MRRRAPRTAARISSNCDRKAPPKPNDTEAPSHGEDDGEDDGEAAAAREKNQPPEARWRFAREIEGEGTAEAEVQCQPLPSGRLPDRWLEKLRAIPRSRH